MKKFLSVFFVLFFMMVIGLNTINVSAATTDTYVGQVSIFASKESGSGHAFLMFKNTSAETYMVGHYSLAPNEYVTLGTWGNKDDGKGVYYNLEAYFINTYDAYSDRVSLKMYYTESELDTFTNYINANNTWTLRKNCAFFAERIWNSVATGNMEVNAGFIIKTPKTLYNDITSKTTYYNAQYVPAVDANKVKRHTASSSSSVSSGTLSSSSSS